MASALNNNQHTHAQRGTHNDTSVQQDTGNEIWDTYLDEVKKDDERIAKAWNDDSTGILVFTGLFSATVGAFIIEFYKQLTPSSNLTITRLENGTYSITGDIPPPLGASIVWVNAMWLISLVLSLTSALMATLLQQWARRYADMPDRPSDPNHRARVRSVLFHGTETYKMRLVVQIAPTLLHLSVYLFFAGLGIVFHTINKSVAIAVYVSVGVFGVAYVALTILPCLDVQCPYRTPMSHFLWYPTHAILSLTAVCLHWLLEQLHGCLVGPNLGTVTTRRQRILTLWLESRAKAVKTHRQYIMDGIRKSIINSAIDTGGDGDRRIVTRLFNLLAMGDKSKLRKFAASIPRDKVLDLIPGIKSGKIVLQEPLRILLQSCAASPSVAGPDEEVRKRSLVVCLGAIHNIVKDPSVPDLNYVRANYANIGLMRAWLDSSDTAIRVTSHSICALLAKQVVAREVLEPLEEQQLRWLQDVTGSRAVYNADRDRRNRMNIKSFVRGVFSNQVGDLPTEYATSFNETLAVLLDMDVENDADFERNFQTRLSQVVDQLHRDDTEDNGDVVHRLRTMFRLPIPSTDPSSHAQVVPLHVPNIAPPSHVGPSLIAGQSYRYLA